MAITLDDVQHLADQLSPLDQVRLIEHLSRQVALALASPSDTSTNVGAEDGWAKLARLREELDALPADRLASEQLAADRAERQALLEGAVRVHPQGADSRLPILTGGTWADDLPLSRKDLYGADERC